MTTIRLRRTAVAAVVAAALLAASSAPLLAHSPTPPIGWPAWNQGQVVKYRWMAGEVPPSRMQAAIRAGAEDANDSKYSRAPTIVYDSGGTSTVEYGANVFCGVNGLACADARNAPSTFRVAFRLHGWRFDWGQLRWCQLLDPVSDGCYDVENIMLDELGHVLGLGHHANYSDQRDYGDSVVQTVSRARPKRYWNEHDFGRCDIARLQMQYDMTSWTAGYSSCLNLPVALALRPSSSSIRVGTTMTFTATLAVLDSAGDGRLGGNPVSRRTVLLHRRVPGTSTWTSMGTMTPTSAAGTYALKQSPTRTYEWRAVFPDPAEGLRGGSSGVVAVPVSGCSTSSCPRATAADGEHEADR